MSLPNLKIFEVLYCRKPNIQENYRKLRFVLDDNIASVHLLAAQVYHTKKIHPNGETSWQGGKDLASSAFFTAEFVQAILGCWERHHALEERCGEAHAICLESDSD